MDRLPDSAGFNHSDQDSKAASIACTSDWHTPGLVFPLLTSPFYVPGIYALYLAGSVRLSVQAYCL